MTRIFAIVAVLVVGAGIIWYATRPDETTGVEYRFVEVSKGNLESVVASTGTLDAVTTVQVGTQVSGIVNRIYVDFNDPVRRGQVIARIDTTLLASSVRDAMANLVRARAQIEFNQREYDRVKELHEKGFTTEVALNQAAYNLDIAKAGIQTASISLERAERNLSYATIISPINGVIIERNVDEGQTVAASLSAPQLFLIANDLKRLEIQASVDEGDIGEIKPGQTARFTVQAFNNQMFEGIVRQVRLQSTVANNVVTYTAVIDVDNADGRLLPGMTATVDFLIERVENVFMIPNAALRFRPTERMTTDLRSRPDSGSRPAGGRPAAMGGGRPGGSSAVMLWYLDEAGTVQTVRAETGISDGSSTEVRGEGLAEGMQIIAGVTESEASGGFNNPFQANSEPGGGGRFGRGGGF